MSGAGDFAVGIGLSEWIGASLVTQKPADCLSSSLSFAMVLLPCSFLAVVGDYLPVAPKRGECASLSVIWIDWAVV